MEFKHFFTPAKFDNLSFPIKKNEGALIDDVIFFKGEEDFSINGYDIAIIGIEVEAKLLVGDNLKSTPNAIRPYLYHLKTLDNLKIADLGNLVGETKKDRMFLLQEILSYLHSKQVTAIIIGGSDDYIQAQYNAVKDVEVENRLKLTLIDSCINGGKVENDTSPFNYLTSLVDKARVDITILGVQNYYNSTSQIEFANNAFVDILRLKDVRDDKVQFTEVPLRDSSVIGFDLTSLASSAMPACSEPRPNGFSALDACQLGWYSGVSKEVKSFALSNFDLRYDINKQGVALAGQIIWHFIYGFSNKTFQISLKDVTSFQKFNVHLESYGVYINFFSSLDGARWWVEVVDNKNLAVVSCDKSDYYEAIQGEMPKKWWRYFLRNQFLDKN